MKNFLKTQSSKAVAAVAGSFVLLGGIYLAHTLSRYATMLGQCQKAAEAVANVAGKATEVTGKVNDIKEKIPGGVELPSAGGFVPGM